MPDLILTATQWLRISKFDPVAVGFYSRHYSSKKSGKTARDWLRYGITSPGESITLLLSDSSALFVWLKQKYHGNENKGINCAVFRNEGEYLSSELILEAEQIAWQKWPGERLFTYVNQNAIRSKNPGFCFLQAGWKKCGVTKSKLIILEKLPNVE